jgi:hypothetical protein
LENTAPPPPSELQTGNSVLPFEHLCGHLPQSTPPPAYGSSGAAHRLFLGTKESEHTIPHWPPLYHAVLEHTRCYYGCYLCLVRIVMLAILCFSNFKISIWNPKQIQIKKLLIIKFYNFSRSTTLLLVVSPFEVVFKIQISDLRISNIIFYNKMISN